MKKCALCSTELKFTNTPTFGLGKLKDGNSMCIKCCKKLYKTNASLAGKLKKYSLSEIQKIMQEKYEEETQNLTRLNKIKEEIKNLKFDHIPPLLDKKEINELPYILSSNEIIDNAIQGIYHSGMGVLISTNRRLVFIDKGFISGLKVEDFPLEKITTIEYEIGSVQGKIKVHTPANTAEITNVDKIATRQFAEFVRNKLSSPPNEESKNGKTEPTIIKELEKLGELKSNGVITEDEFAELKKKLLEGL